MDFELRIGSPPSTGSSPVLHPPGRLLVSPILLVVVGPARRHPVVGVDKVTAVVDLGELHVRVVQYFSPIPRLRQTFATFMDTPS